MWRWLRRIVVSAVVLQVLGVGATVWAYPVLGAAACPQCYGFERVSANLVVGRDMAPERRVAVAATIYEARERVRTALGLEASRAVVVACPDRHCDARMGGKGARATTYSTMFGSIIRAGPNGLDGTILTHEMVHVAVHRHVGILRQMRGGLPAWFDEGLAVIVSNDRRFLAQGADGTNRCLEPFDPSLPASPFEWAPRAGDDPAIYASAACGVLEWLAENGGADGLTGLLGRIAEGAKVEFR